MAAASSDAPRLEFRAHEVVDYFHPRDNSFPYIVRFWRPLGHEDRLAVRWRPPPRTDGVVMAGAGTGNPGEHTEVDSHKPFPQTWRLKPTNTPVSPPGTTRTRQYPRRGPATHAGDHSPLTRSLYKDPSVPPTPFHDHFPRSRARSSLRAASIPHSKTTQKHDDKWILFTERLRARSASDSLGSNSA
jgi:hypothetical protein